MALYSIDNITKLLPSLSKSLILILVASGTVLIAAANLAKRQAVPPQNPPVLQALDQLRGNEAFSATQIQQILAASYPGSSYPTYSYIPQTSFSCNQVKQFGFYADPETRCQVFRRCEANNYMFSYICPNGTVFNQITLICDWFYNVQCPSAGGFFDYSNPRIYRQDLRLFDDYHGNGLSGYGASSGAGYGYGAAGGAGGMYGYAMSGSGPIPSVTGTNVLPTNNGNNLAASPTITGKSTADGQPQQQYRRIFSSGDNDPII